MRMPQINIYKSKGYGMLLLRLLLLLCYFISDHKTRNSFLLPWMQMQTSWAHAFLKRFRRIPIFERNEIAKASVGVICDSSFSTSTEKKDWIGFSTDDILERTQRTHTFGQHKNHARVRIIQWHKTLQQHQMEIYIFCDEHVVCCDAGAEDDDDDDDNAQVFGECCRKHGNRFGCHFQQSNVMTLMAERDPWWLRDGRRAVGVDTVLWCLPHNILVAHKKNRQIACPSAHSHYQMAICQGMSWVDTTEREKPNWINVCSGTR